MQIPNTPTVDVVVVSYNSRDRLRGCVVPLLEREDVRVIVVDNASPDRSLESVADLPIVALQTGDNLGFARGCNAGWRAGDAPFVLFLNPDARLDGESLDAMVDALRSDRRVGIVGPKILDSDGTLDYSQRRYARLRSTYAQALFLHRLFPKARWTDEMVRDADVYERTMDAEWLSGACLLVRRALLEDLGGFDERFFMYCEDQDLCRRVKQRGFAVRFEPAAVATHEGGASAPSAAMVPVLASSRLLYAKKHSSRVGLALTRVGIALGAFTHMLVGRGGSAERGGHVRALVAAARR